MRYRLSGCYKDGFIREFTTDSREEAIARDWPFSR